MKCRTGIGQDSHRFLPPDSSKPCVLGGIVFEDESGFSANSDGDVVFHALCNALSSITGILILGGLADELLEKDGITDSEAYLVKAMETLGNKKITHVAITIEAKRPKMKGRFEEMRENIARVLGIQKEDVGVTATTGEGLTDFGCGEGAQAFCIVTTVEP